ncbi:MAG: adenine deaminase [Alphaproteobacteria bacterium]
MAVQPKRVSRQELDRRIDQALGRAEADLVIRGARFLNVATGELDRGDIAICGDTIVGTYADYRGAVEIDGRDAVVVPGFIDTHVHVESCCITPLEFDRCVLPKGTTTAICDPHEIANVLGEAGLGYFLSASEGLAMDLRVQLSSCVPATDLETSGARLDAADLLRHRDHPKVIGLAEFMNFPGVFAKDEAVLEKLSAFSGGHIDGHAPLVGGRELNAYAACGIRNCHESTGLEEGREKLRKGMQVLIRDGSACKDVVTLTPLIDPVTAPFLAFCTDDRNPLDIAEEGHVDHLIRTAIAHGADPAAVYRAASWSAARGFGLADRGLIAPGWRADLVLLDDLHACAVRQVIRAGTPVTPALFDGRPAPAAVGRRSIRLDPVTPAVFATPAAATGSGTHGSGGTVPVIGIVPGQVVTEHRRLELPAFGGLRRADPARDILHVCVLSRHGHNRNVGRGFVQGMGLARGALASSVGHDSHNVIVVGADPAEMARAVNRLIEIEGGFVAVAGDGVVGEVPLPVAGLMSDRPFEEVADGLRRLRAAVKALGCPLAEPFLQMAFLPLAVIPHLKITDRGLVDVDRFELVAA